jgi:hypothetical protein
MKLINHPSARIWCVATLCIVCTLIAIAYIVHGSPPSLPHMALEVEQPRTLPSKSSPAEPSIAEAPSLLFRHTAMGDAYGKLAFVRLNQLGGPLTSINLRCDRVHYAAGRGVCLTARRGVFTTYEAIVFDASFQPLYTVPLRGTPSRTRVSGDGRVGAITVFVSGHSYAAASFSTHTSIIDLKTGTPVALDLEKFTVWKDGERFQAIDFNVWGVTFSDNHNRFYATLGSGGRTYLIEGDTLTQTAWVRHSDIECPSLSPDNSHLAFKKRLTSSWGPVTWRLAVLDLATEREWLLAETRSIDDQAEWLDDATVLYALPDRTLRSAAMHTWAVAADGSGEPHMFLADAYSPVVVHLSLSQNAWPQAVMQ